MVNNINLDKEKNENRKTTPFSRSPEYDGCVHGQTIIFET